MSEHSLLFYFFSSLALVSGMLVIRSKNPVHSVLFLILVFCNVAGLLILLNLDFFAMIFLVVYVGAIAVLFLFVVISWFLWFNFPGVATGATLPQQAGACQHHHVLLAHGTVLVVAEVSLADCVEHSLLPDEPSIMLANYLLLAWG